MILIELFLSFSKIGLLSLGGGYAAIPLIREEAVERRAWIDMNQFADILSISEVTPGPIAINSATFVGIETAGLPGAVAATLGCALPPCAVLMLLAFLYYRFKGMSAVQGVLLGLQPVVTAMIASAGVSLLIIAIYGESGGSVTSAVPDIGAIAIFVVCFLILRKKKFAPIYVMLGAGLITAALYLLA